MRLHFRFIPMRRAAAAAAFVLLLPPWPVAAERDGPRPVALKASGPHYGSRLLDLGPGQDQGQGQSQGRPSVSPSRAAAAAAATVAVAVRQASSSASSLVQGLQRGAADPSGGLPTPASVNASASLQGEGEAPGGAAASAAMGDVVDDDKLKKAEEEEEAKLGSGTASEKEAKAQEIAAAAENTTLRNGIEKLDEAFENPRAFLMKMDGMVEFDASLSVAVKESGDSPFCLKAGEFAKFGCKAQVSSTPLCACKGLFEQCGDKHDANAIVQSWKDNNTADALMKAKELMFGQCFTPLWVTFSFYSGLLSILAGIGGAVAIKLQRRQEDD